MKNIAKSILLVALLTGVNTSILAHTDEDINGFLKAGKFCYQKGMLDEAALEFENVLIMDKTNLQAKLWLTQIYIDKKDLKHARKLLSEASLEAPDNNKVKELQKLLGISYKDVKPDLVDPVIAETINGIASATKSRKYGLVIPEDKVVEENLEKKLLTFNNETFDEKNEVIQTIEKAREDIKKSRLDINNYVTDKDSPLAPVFTLYNTYGITKALDKYFEMIMQDPSIASKDDKGLIDEGEQIYSVRFTENADDLEARFYYGCIKYVNGEYENAEELLKPFRTNPGTYAARLKPFFTGLDFWQEQEKQRIAAAKYEEEQRLAKEAKEKKEAEEKKNDVWEMVKNQGTNKDDNKNADLASASDKAEANKIHTEAYTLYKKGKLDDAIAKFDEALAKDPNNPEFNYHLGLAWTDKGLAGDTTAFENAVTAYQKVISVAPDSKLAKDATSMINDIQQAKHSLGER